MIFPKPMMRLTAVILRNEADKVTRALLNEGVVDFVDIKSKEFPLSEYLASIHQQTSTTDILDLRQRIERFMAQADISLPQLENLNAEDLKQVEPQTIVSKLDSLTAQIAKIREQQKQIQQRLNKKAEILRHIEHFGDLAGMSSSESAVAVHFGLIRKSRKDGFEQAFSLYPSVVHFIPEEGDELSVVLVYMKRDEKQINPILDRFQWHFLDLPSDISGTKEDIVRVLKDRSSLLAKEQEQLRHQTLATIKDNRPFLLETWKNLTIAKHYVRIQDQFGKTAETVLFTGWIPKKHQEKTEKLLDEVTTGHCYTEWTRPEDDTSFTPKNIPVKLEHSALLRPFQWIVENYSLPQYGSVDPTIIVAISYLAMFGLMFGDAGHGFVLTIVGIITAFAGREKKATAYQLGRLIALCGCSSILTGVLFGSYFGYAAFAPLWFDYHGIVMGHKGSGLVDDVYAILAITVYFGIAIIGCGIILNIINHLKAKRYLNLFFDKGGLLGGWFYAGGINAAFFFVSNGYKALPGINILFLTLFLPGILFFFKPLCSFWMKRRQQKAVFKPGLLVEWVMDWVVELLELFSGYLSNTLSFMRIAGLGIAHVSLMTAFFQIAAQIDSMLGKAVVLILGNMLVIALEGLSAGIQSLRLNYYEFFSKYFRGYGKAYEPISIRKHL